MIIGIGTDIFEVARMKKRIEKETSFIESVFTTAEINCCEKYKFKEQNYAARFAAKESLMKALGTGWRNGMSFLDINIINDQLGKPKMFLTGETLEVANKLGITDIQLSLSHSQKYAIAFIIVSKNN